MATMPEYISDIRFYKTSGNGRFEGSGTVTIADSLAVKFTIFSNDNSLRLVLPNEVNPNFNSDLPVGKSNQKYFDLVFPISREARQQLESAIIGKLIEVREKEQTMDQTVPF